MTLSWRASGDEQQQVNINEASAAIDSFRRIINTRTDLSSSMAPSNPLAYWERVGDSFYRKVPVYDAIFDEDVELENYIVAGAPYGGAIGMVY